MAHQLMAEPSLIDLVSKLPLIEDPFEEDSVVDGSAFISSEPTPRVNMDERYHAKYGQRFLADIVSALPVLDDLFEEDSVLERMDCSTTVPSKQALLKDADRQVQTENCERSRADVVSDLAMLDDLFEQDSFPEEMDYSTSTPSQPIPCSSKRYDYTGGHWDDDEAYFSYNSVSEGNSWLAAQDPAYSSYNSYPSVEPNESFAFSSSIPLEVPTLCIDPILTSFPTQSALSAMIAEERQSQSSVVTAVPCQSPQSEEKPPPSNEFDTLFAETMNLPVLPPTPPIDQASLGWLDHWLKQNPSRMPSSKELACLEGLTSLPGSFILAWLTQRSPNSPQAEFADPGASRTPPAPPPEDPNPQPNLQKPTTTISPPSSSCSSRPCQPQKPLPHPQHHSPSKYHCTHHCGSTFTRRSDWARHERKRFESWLCPLPSCGASLTRKEKLRDHLRVVHDRLVVGRGQLDGCRRVKDGDREGGAGAGAEAVMKVCGFCAEGLGTWDAWLGHVGDHFEGGGDRK